MLLAVFSLEDRMPYTLGTPEAEHLLVTGCFVLGSLNYHHISHLRTSLVKPRRTYRLICHLMRRDKGLTGRGWQIWLVFQQVAHQLSESGALFSRTPMCHTVVRIVLEVLGWGTTHPFAKQERQCRTLKLAFLSSNMARAETVKSYVSVKRDLDVKSIKGLTTRQKIIWTVFCLYLFISIKATLGLCTQQLLFTSLRGLQHLWSSYSPPHTQEESGLGAASWVQDACWEKLGEDGKEIWKKIKSFTKSFSYFLPLMTVHFFPALMSFVEDICTVNCAWIQFLT